MTDYCNPTTRLPRAEAFDVLADHFEKAAANGVPVWRQNSWGEATDLRLGRRMSLATIPAEECGTYACIAGWADILLAPEMMEWRPARGLDGRPMLGSGAALYVSDDSPHAVPTLAAELLHLSPSEADSLFECQWRPFGHDDDLPDNHPDNLRALADHLRMIGAGMHPDGLDHNQIEDDDR